MLPCVQVSERLGIIWVIVTLRDRLLELFAHHFRRELLVDRGSLCCFRVCCTPLYYLCLGKSLQRIHGLAVKLGPPGCDIRGSFFHALLF